MQFALIKKIILTKKKYILFYFRILEKKFQLIITFKCHSKTCKLKKSRNSKTSEYIFVTAFKRKANILMNFKMPVF